MGLNAEVGNGAASETAREGREAPIRKILIVEDHPVVSLSLEAGIRTTPGLASAGVVKSAAEALAAIDASPPDGAIVDLALEDSSGLDLIHTIRDRLHRFRILVCSARNDPVWVERALAAGADGYVDKQEPLDAILEALRRVLAGETFVSEGLRSRMLAAPAEDPAQRLSRRELEVFRLIAEGRKTGEIARRLGVSVHTVDSHRRNIKHKLDLASAPELARAAVRWLEAERL